MPNTASTARKGIRRGKAHERATAKLLNGKRVGVTGLATQDVDCGWLSVECKSVKALPGYVRAALDQAHRNCRDGQLAVAVFHGLGDRHERDVVMLTMADWRQWFGEWGPVPEPAEPTPDF
jgi:hypothetical protein